MEIYLLRHGDAESGRDIPDEGRVLSEEGRRQVTRSARAMTRLVPSAPVVLTSPLARARQTAELAAAELKPSPAIKVLGALAPPGDFNDLMDEIKKVDGDRVLLVGHEPFLGRLIWAMVAGDSPGARDTLDVSDSPGAGDSHGAGYSGGTGESHGPGGPGGAGGSRGAGDPHGAGGSRGPGGSSGSWRSPGSLPMRKAAMARVDLATPVLGDGRLIWFIPPEILSELATS